MSENFAKIEIFCQIFSQKIVNSAESPFFDKNRKFRHNILLMFAMFR